MCVENSDGHVFLQSVLITWESVVRLHPVLSDGYVMVTYVNRLEAFHHTRDSEMGSLRSRGTHQPHALYVGSVRAVAMREEVPV